LFVSSFFEVIAKLLFIQTEFEFTFFCPQNHRLAFHPAHQVERGPGLSAQRQFEHVLRDPRLQRLLQFRGDFEEAVRRTEAADALVRPAVVVVTHPQLEPLVAFLEAIELGPDQKLLPQARPEPFHLPQGHRVLRTRHQVRHPVLCQHPGKAARPPPVGVLRAAIGEHFLGRLVLADRPPVRLDHRLARRAAVQAKAGDVTRVVVQERHDVRVSASEPEGEDVALPHLIGRRPLEKARPAQIARAFSARGLQPGVTQTPPHRFGADPEEEPAAQHFGNALHAKLRVRPLHRHDLLGHRGRKAAPRPGRRLPA
jgi:hypothetical protein